MVMILTTIKSTKLKYKVCKLFNVFTLITFNPLSILLNNVYKR